MAIAVFVVSIGLVAFVYDFNEKNNLPEPTSGLEDDTLKQKLKEKTPTSGYDILPIYDEPMYNAVFSGDIAEKICRFMEIPCPAEPKFKGNYDFADKSGGLMFVDGQDSYLFRITGNDNQILVKLRDVDRYYVTLPEYAAKETPNNENQNNENQNNEIEIYLDKQSYELGDSIKISGMAYDYRNDPIIVNIF